MGLSSARVSKSVSVYGANITPESVRSYVNGIHDLISITLSKSFLIEEAETLF